MDIVINGKVVKKDYITKCHHTRTDIYHFRCVPTLAGVIEVSIQGDPEVKGGRGKAVEKEGGGARACKCCKLKCQTRTSEVLYAGV